MLPMTRLQPCATVFSLLLVFCGTTVKSDDDDGAATTNPYSSGCFKEQLPGWTKVRVCNSEDPPETAAAGLCRPPDADFDYTEIRILSQNWEAAFFQTWLLQILFSELLDIPSSVETGLYGKRINFYDRDSAFDFGTSGDYGSFRTATRLGGNCGLANQRDEATYESCATVVGEVWDINSDLLVELYAEGMIEQPQTLGALFQEAWYMTRFTVDQDVTLLTYFGLHGEENRQKLADTFLRPTNWKDYCEQVSPNNCTTPDDVAKHAPVAESDNTRFYVEGDGGELLYTGHFRKTEHNDCEANPTTCTGHIAAYPCSWPSFVSLKAHWLKIALESSGDEGDGGYSYSQLLELWAAANATRSNLAMQWWQPEVLYQKYVGTDAAFTRVYLPDPTLECKNAQRLASRRDRCSGEYSPKDTSPLAACDFTPVAVKKLIATGLRKAAFDPKIPEPLQSPGFEAASRFTLSELQLQVMMGYSQELGNPRQAICRWAVENVEFLKGFAPKTYPRVVQTRGDTMDALSYAALALGGVAVCLVLVTSLLVFLMRNHRIFRVAQHEFLGLLLSGSLVVSAGSIVAGLMPSHNACISTIWLVNVGYCLHLVPLIIKVAAINRTAQRAAKRMKRVVLSPRSLFLTVAAVLVPVVAYLVAWTIVDTPQVAAFYDLTDDVDESGNTIVDAHEYCGSASRTWSYVSVAWPAVVLALAASLAWETRHLLQHFAEAQTLARLVFVHSGFLVVRVVLLVFASNADSIAAVYVARSMTFAFSLDMIAGTWLYFAPKFFSPDEAARENGRLGSSMSAASDNESGSRRSKSTRGESRIDATDDSSLPNPANNNADPAMLPEQSPNGKSLASMESSVDAGDNVASASEGDAGTQHGDATETRNRDDEQEVPEKTAAVVDDRQSALLLDEAAESGEHQAQDGGTNEIAPMQCTGTAAAATDPGGSTQLCHVTIPTKLGVSVEPVDADAGGGLRVYEVDPSSDFFGRIFPGDVVVGFGGVATTTAEELTGLLQNYKTLTVRRSSPAAVRSDGRGHDVEQDLIQMECA